jgi:hypothetical protein
VWAGRSGRCAQGDRTCEELGRAGGGAPAARPPQPRLRRRGRAPRSAARKGAGHGPGIIVRSDPHPAAPGLGGDLALVARTAGARGGRGAWDRHALDRRSGRGRGPHIPTRGLPGVSASDSPSTCSWDTASACTDPRRPRPSRRLTPALAATCLRSSRAWPVRCSALDGLEVQGHEGERHRPVSHPRRRPGPKAGNRLGIVGRGREPEQAMAHTRGVQGAAAPAAARAVRSGTRVLRRPAWR